MTVFGWDASHYDWDRNLTADEVRAAPSAGIAFMTHKIGEGGDYTDPRFDDWWRAAKGLRDRMLLGAYFVNHPGDQKPQADRFLRLLDQQAPGWRDGPFILQVDAEKFSYMPRQPTLSEIKAFVGRLRDRAPQFQPIVYAPKWLYGDSLRGLDAPLWASNYGSNPAQSFRSAYPGDGSSRWDAYSGQTPAILQYGSQTRIGTQTTCDANAYRGSLAQLAALVYPQGDDMVTADDVQTIAVETAQAVHAQRIGRSTTTIGMALEMVPRILAAVTGQDADDIVAAIEAEGEQTRAALVAEVRQLAPTLAGEVADRLGGEVSAGEIGEALARELAALLGGAAGGPSDQSIVA